MKILRGLARLVPILFGALLLAIVVWVAAVNSTDPTEEVSYPTPIPVEVLGLKPVLVLTGNIPEEVFITIRAPRSIQDRLAADPRLIQAVVNLSNLGAGQHNLVPKVTIGLEPTQVTRITPETLTYTIEDLTTRSFPVELRKTGSLPISYEAGTPELSAEEVQVLGAKSQVDRVRTVVALVDLTDVTSTFSKNIVLSALDSRGNPVSAVNISPNTLEVTMPVKQLSDYRNVVVRIVTSGNIARGFHLTGIASNPPSITIYSTDPGASANMPDYIETLPVNLGGASESFTVTAMFDLPTGIDIVGNQEVEIAVGIQPTVGSVQLLAIPIQAENLPNGMRASFSPATVNVYVSGPMLLLEQISSGSVRVTIDLSGKEPGTYNLAPQVQLDAEELRVDSVTPGVVEVRLAQ